MKAMPIIMFLGTAAGLSAVACAAGKGPQLLSGAASLLGAAAGGKGRGAGGCRTFSPDFSSVLSSLKAKAAACGAKLAECAKGRGHAQDARPAAGTAASEAAGTDTAAAQTPPKPAENASPERDEAVRFLESCIVSSTRGRVRLRHGRLKGCPALEAMHLAAAGIPGVKTTEACLRTGSLLATWDEGAVSLNGILAAMADVPAVRAAACS